MTGHTHAVIGANAAWIAAVLGVTGSPLFLCAAAGALAGLLPDIEAEHAKVHSLFYGLFRPFRKIVAHRGFTHSFLCIVIVFLLSLFLVFVHPVLPLVITCGYMTHPLIDGLNTSGVQYLYPRKKKYNLFPKSLRTPVGGIVDHLLFIGGVYGLVVLLYFSL